MTRRVSVLLLRLSVTLGALILILRAVSAEAILETLRSARMDWILLAAGALALQIALSALRWRQTATALGLDLSHMLALREYWLAVLGNTLLPGGVLGDIGRALRLRGQAGLGLAAETVVIERLAGQLALAVATLCGIALWFWPDRAGQTAVAGAVALVALLWIALRYLRAGRGVAGRLLTRLHLAWIDAGRWQLHLTLSLAILFCNLLGFWAAAQAVGVALDATAALFVLPVTLAAMLVPISVNGWGLREGTAALLWPMAGVAPEAAVAASVIFGLAALLAALPGTLVPFAHTRPA